MANGGYLFEIANNVVFFFFYYILFTLETEFSVHL